MTWNLMFKKIEKSLFTDNLISDQNNNVSLWLTHIQPYTTTPNIDNLLMHTERWCLLQIQYN